MLELRSVEWRSRVSTTDQTAGSSFLHFDIGASFSGRQTGQLPDSMDFNVFDTQNRNVFMIIVTS